MERVTKAEREELLSQRFILIPESLARSDTNPEAHAMHISTENVFEGIGVMVQRNLIDSTLVTDLLWMALGNYWERFGPIWKEWRTRTGHMSLADHTEYLYDYIRELLPTQTFDTTRL
jgi:hypothetical protein